MTCDIIMLTFQLDNLCLVSVRTHRVTTAVLNERIQQFHDLSFDIVVLYWRNGW